MGQESTGPGNPGAPRTVPCVQVRGTTSTNSVASQSACARSWKPKCKLQPPRTVPCQLLPVSSLHQLRQQYEVQALEPSPSRSSCHDVCAAVRAASSCWLGPDVLLCRDVKRASRYVDLACCSYSFELRCNVDCCCHRPVFIETNKQPPGQRKWR
jgi:hypothetical protein